MAPNVGTRTESASDLTWRLRKSFTTRGVGQRECGSELVGERDGGDTLLDGDHHLGIADEDESGGLDALREDRELDTVGRERDPARKPALLRRGDVPTALEAGHGVQEGRELEEAVVEREQRAELSGHRVRDVAERRAARHEIGDAVDARDRVGRLLPLVFGAAAA